MSQLSALIDGYSILKNKEADAIKRSSRHSGGDRVEANMSNLHKFSGIKVVKRKN